MSAYLHTGEIKVRMSVTSDRKITTCTEMNSLRLVISCRQEDLGGVSR